MYHIVSQYFYRLYSTKRYYKVLFNFSGLYNVSLYLTSFRHSCLYLLIPFTYPALPSFPLPLVVPGTMEATQGVKGLGLAGRWFHW